jgi:transcription elongation factor SPT5
VTGVSRYTKRCADSSSPKTGMSYPLEAAGGGSYGGAVPQRPGGGYDINPYGGAANPAANVSSVALPRLPSRPETDLAQGGQTPGGFGGRTPAARFGQTPNPYASGGFGGGKTPNPYAAGGRTPAPGAWGAGGKTPAAGAWGAGGKTPGWAGGGGKTPAHGFGDGGKTPGWAGAGGGGKTPNPYGAGMAGGRTPAPAGSMYGESSSSSRVSLSPSLSFR